MEPVLMLSRQFETTKQACEECGGTMLASGFDTTEWLAEATLNAQDRRRRLTTLGLRSGDVFTLRQGNLDRHFEFDGSRDPSKNRQRIEPA